MPVSSETRDPLSVEAITEAALRLVDADGLDQLSMRKLGNALGYEAMALYKHVSDKQGVIDAMVAAVVEEMSLPDPGTDWRSRLRHLAGELRDTALRHPELLVSMMTNPPPTPAVVERIDAILAALRDSGIDDTDVPHHFWFFVNTTTGALVAEVRALTGPPPSPATPVGPDAAARIEECRAMIRFGPALAACDFAAEYERTIDTLISLIG